MTLVRWTPSHAVPTFPSDLFGLQSELNRMFDGLFHGDREETDVRGSTWKPAVDIVENDDEYVAKVELPGVNKDDVKITMENNILTLRGEKSQETKEKSSNYHRVERYYGSFRRSFELPGGVKNDKIDAEYKDGILTIRMPKEEEAKTRLIEVKVR